MRLRKPTRLLLLLTLLGIFSFPLMGDARTHNLAAEWSDTVNPNGLWSYNAGDTPMTNRQHWYEVNGWVWGISSGWSLPVAFKITTDNPYGFDFKAGDTGVHGDYIVPTNLVWTSDISGHARVRGNAWLVRNIGRNMYWGVYVNEVLKTSGLMTAGSYSRAAPFDFLNGSGGESALTFRVAPGTKITLSLWVPPDKVPDYVGLDFTIDAIPDQLWPGTMLLLLD
ncbi:MAG TPA: hypothetical protein DCY27_00460 [Desulfobacterales bacterium]|nr:hypothetical protein [Desulfobacterales bacterium]